MSQARVWTESADQAICEMRGAGAIWAVIGQVLGLSRNTVIERGRRLRAVAPPRPVTAMKTKDKDGLDDPNRPPLRAGHPLTRGLLTDEVFPEGDE